MDKILMIGVGGGLGSIVRYLLSTSIQSKLENASFPFGTIVVNIAGCLVIGFLSYLSDVKGVISSDLRMFLFIGVLGGFTTFSTYMFELAEQLRDAQWLAASGYFALHNLGGWAAMILGLMIGKWI